MAENYFNSLPLRLQVEELAQCRFMEADEFNGVEALKGKKIVIVGCGAQGLNQGLNLRDSGLDVSYTLRESAISEQRQSWKNATEHGFTSRRGRLSCAVRCWASRSRVATRWGS